MRYHTSASNRPVQALLTAIALIAMSGCAATGKHVNTTTLPDVDDGMSLLSSDPVWVSAEKVTALCEQRLNIAGQLRDHLRQNLNSPRTTDNTLVVLNTMFKALEPASGWSGLIFSTHPDEAIRDAAQACQQRVADFYTEISLDRAIYDAVAGVELANADPLTRRFAQKLLLDFSRSGVDKDETTRERLTAIQSRLVQLKQQYGENVRNDVRDIRIPVDGMKGLPQDYIDAHLPGDDGMVRITTDYPDFFPFETYAEDESHRASLYNQFASRGYPANRALLEEILKLRHEQATILGHESWASYHAGDKMAGSAETISAFIDDLVSAVRPKAETEIEVLLKRKRQDSPHASGIEVWDRFFYVGRVRQAEHDFDARSVRPYFSFPRVTRGILDLYGMLFGLEFVHLPDAPTWSPDVKAYEMRSEGALIGRFFLDMHPRAGKYKHAAAFDVQTGVAGGRIPVGTLVCNFPSPDDGDGRALMEHGDVVTYFHEFGHLIHLLMARRSPWVTLNGFNVEWDFVEAPSQLLEEWAWDPAVLARFATHIDTEAVIPAELVGRMRAADEFGKGVHVMRQIFYTAYSFFMHSEDPESLDLEAFTDRIYANYSPYSRIEDDHVYANFGHLIGYSSGYYTYQWSLVIAKDLFTRFAAEGLLNTQVAMDYRRAILEAGGTADAADLVRSFLGRDYNREAYKEWLSRD